MHLPGARSRYDCLLTMSNCPHGYPQMWKGRSITCRSLPATARDLRAAYNLSVVWAASRSAILASLLTTVSVRNGSAEANSFRCGCQPFIAIRIGSRCECGRSRVRWWRELLSARGFCVCLLGRARFDQAKARQYPQTVARKSAMRLRPGLCVWGPRRPAAKLPSADDLHSMSGRMVMSDTARRTPWPRASGPSSRITGGEPAFMVSDCGCAPGRVGPSCRVGGVKAAAH